MTIMPAMGWGKRIADMRERRGLTQAQLAAAIGRKQSVISDYEREVTAPPLETFLRIAEVLKTTPEYLVFGIGGTERDEKPRDPTTALDREHLARVITLVYTRLRREEMTGAEFARQIIGIYDLTRAMPDKTESLVEEYFRLAR